MPNFLKSLFKPSSRTSSSHPQPVASTGSPSEYSPMSPSTESQALKDIAQYMKVNGDSGGLEDGTMQRLLDVLEGIRDDRSRRQISPCMTQTSTPQLSGRDRDGGAWGEAMRACDDLIAQRDIHGSKQQLEAQKAELVEIRPYAENKQLPSLVALAGLYRSAEQRLSVSSTDEMDDLLRDAPEYLISVIVIEAIIWQAEVIDPSLGAEIRELLNNATAKGQDVHALRKAIINIAQRLDAVDEAVLDDELAKDAHRAIGSLLRQLRDRFPSDAPPSDTPRTLSAAAAPTASPGLSPASSSRSCPTPSTQDAKFEQLDARSLQARFGTGITPSTSASPLATRTPSAVPTPSARLSVAPTPAAPTPDSPASPAESEQSIWEYRGQLLTRSALELVMRQEALAAADSSGQYAGEVSWDDLRQAWIPKWAAKLRPGEVADGEVPSTNPADYKEKKEDAWGNKMGWYNGRMYYHEDPTFDLKD